MIQSKERFRRPEIFLRDLLKTSGQGRLLLREETVPFLFRATVIAIDVVGGKLENPDGSGTVTHVFDGKKVDVPAIVGVENPRNSIKARIITDGYDQFISDDRLRVFWPFYPEHISVPIKPGEHVYVTFEDSDTEHGLWFSKVPGHENLNFFRGQKSFKEEGEGSLSNKFDDTRQSDSEEDALNTDDQAGESEIDNGRLQDLFE